MNDSFIEIIEGGIKRFLPLFCTFILVLLAFVPVNLPLSNLLRPSFGMICIYFWAFCRQDSLGPLTVAFIGLTVDSLSATPPGINIFAFLLVYVLAAALRNRITTKSFAVNWSGFAIVAFLAFFTKWMLIAVYYSRFPAIGSLIPTYISTVLLYPLIARFNLFIQNTWLAGEEVIYEQG